eukprot:TRINITY_DN3506_c0_g2_i1.p1 TRINITY_DN3506_c0_g2~~TRINITY_DN3506_c0_g2_i1.p1  ORF type:complete len:600 (+),score=65.06 TRINITY_DN3506_c0_g2_i1:1529-3328(+)
MHFPVFVQVVNPVMIIFLQITAPARIKHAPIRFRISAQAFRSEDLYSLFIKELDPDDEGIEFFNEQTIEILRTERLRTYPEPYRGMLYARWRGYLKKNYHDRIDDLNKNWKMHYQTFQDIDLPGTAAQCNLDWSKFLTSLFLECQQWCIKTLREIGYRGPISNINLGSSMNLASVRAEGVDFTTYNTYFAHPTDGWSEIEQSSSIQSGLWHITVLSGVKLRGRPMFVTEYNYGMPNPYGHESGVTMPAFAAFQSYGGLSIHENAVGIKSGFSRPGKEQISAFNVALSPINRANEFMSACFFKRGDVSPAPVEIAYLINREVREKDNLGKFCLSRSMLRLSLIFGAGIEVTDTENKAVSPIRQKALASLFPSGYSDFMVSDFFVKNVDENDKSFDLQKTIETYRAQGFIPKENKTDIKSGIFQSVTGEFMLSLSGMAKVITPYSEAISLMSDHAEKLLVLKVERTSIPAAVGIFSMDGNKLANSKQMILIYSTEMMPEGMELSPSRSRIIKKGCDKALLRTGKLRASLNLPTDRTYELYALSVNGIRRERIPMSVQNGRWEIAIDTSCLENGPTTFFEIMDVAFTKYAKQKIKNKKSNSG